MKSSILNNPVKQKIKSGEVAYGVATSFASPELLEFYGHLGFEWVFIDAEHGPVGRKECVELVRACNVTGLVPVVRVPENNESIILGYLETGVLGIVAPHISTEEDARNLVNSVKYGPVGERGSALKTRAANYGTSTSLTEYYKQANEATLVYALIEDVKGIQNLDEILGIEEIDVVAVGPGDLSTSMGLPGEINHPEVQKIINEANKKIAASGKVITAMVSNAAKAREAVAGGARLVAIPDAILIAESAREFFSAAGKERE